MPLAPTWPSFWKTKSAVVWRIMFFNNVLSMEVDGEDDQDERL